jgi:ABC-type transport system substrate-binding protein
VGELATLLGRHPVGTGPFLLKSYTRSSKIVLEANPGYRENLREGRRLPLIGGVEISIMEETQSRWLAFQRGDTDMEYQLTEIASAFMTAEGTLKPEFASRGIRLERSIDPEIIYFYFNMQDKTVGGLAKERISLRRAVVLRPALRNMKKLLIPSTSEIYAKNAKVPFSADDDPQLGAPTKSLWS